MNAAYGEAAFILKFVLSFRMSAKIDHYIFISVFANGREHFLLIPE
jgi:hypothetical protein